MASSLAVQAPRDRAEQTSRSPNWSNGRSVNHGRIDRLLHITFQAWPLRDRLLCTVRLWPSWGSGTTTMSASLPPTPNDKRTSLHEAAGQAASFSKARVARGRGRQRARRPSRCVDSDSTGELHGRDSGIHFHAWPRGKLKPALEIHSQAIPVRRGAYGSTVPLPSVPGRRRKGGEKESHDPN